MATDPHKRRTLQLLAGGLVTTASGCCSLRGFPQPQIGPPLAAASRSNWLAPLRVNTAGTPARQCIDAHAHFFNASDVTIKGYIEGPLAHSIGGVLGGLLKLLAPLADALGEIAPTAKEEFDVLRVTEARAAARALAPAALRAELLQERHSERERVSAEFNKLVQSARGQRFRQAYEQVMQASVAAVGSERRPRILQLQDDSVLKALQLSEEKVDAAQLSAFAATDRSPYAEGLLAFVGYMLSSRRFNLLTYQDAFTQEDHTIGVERTLGALVDFDRWLDCAPRSAHEDQMKLHLALAQASNDYLLPVISYNPWTDIAESGRSLALVEDAVRAGFVAVKIYPPNGFRPWGNAGHDFPKAPSGADLDAVLQKFWLKCQELGVPVMAHAGPSMGKDAAHDLLSGPDEWQKLLEASFWTAGGGPRVNLGHFGGDSGDNSNEWTQQFAKLMGHARGQRMYADLGYWEQLQCANVGTEKCRRAQERLGQVLNLSIGGGEVVADRVMYGSDWLMLSTQKNWPSYASQLQAALGGVAAPHLERLFSLNAKQCFGQSLRLPA